MSPGKDESPPVGGASPGGARGSARGGEARLGIGRLGLDRLIHEKARLMILVHLASSDRAEIGFTELRDELGFSSGNLSVQLKTLEEAGYLRTEKRFVDKKPYTGVVLTVEGEKALSEYLVDLETIVATLKKTAKEV